MTMMNRSNRRRPKRQRNPTTLYSDDNPSTFTRKVPKSERVEPVAKPPKPSYYYVEEDVEVPSKRPYNRRKSEPIPASTPVVSANGSATTSNAVSATTPVMTAPATTTDPPVKRKRGRPPKNRQSLPAPVTAPIVATVTPTAPAAASSLVSPAEHVPMVTPVDENDVAESSSAAATSMSAVVAATVSNGQHSTPTVVPDIEGTIWNHSVQLSPVLPSQAASPDWMPLPSTRVYFDEDYQADQRLPEDLTPVKTSITCITTRKPDHEYLALGDSMGFCIIYALQPLLRPVARLESLACQRRARELQERIRDHQKRKKKSVSLDTTQTTIHAIAMTATRVVLATACELECMDVPTQTSLWVCPLTQDRIVTSLDMHPSRYDVLVSSSLTTLGQSSPLMLLQHSQNNVEVCDANAPILLKSPCCTAIWDQSKNVEDRLLFVAVANEELELVLVQGGSIDQWKVACKTKIPMRASHPVTRLSQNPSGTYTMVACSRGIRLYQTETLQLIHVYGDQLALHGQAVVWQDSMMLGNRYLEGTQASDGTVRCDDWLSQEEDQEELTPYIIGVPHTKGPKELTEKLHVWRIDQADVVPAFSIPLPPKSDGVQAAAAAPNPSRDRLVVATAVDGQGHMLSPTMKSNFAGCMYPPGYQTLTDNVEYLESESQLDQVVDESQEIDVIDDEDDQLAEDLREAMRQSLLDAQAKNDEPVDVLDTSTTTSSYPIIPCRPETYLRHAVNAPTDSDEDSEENADADLEEDISTPAEQTLDPKWFSNLMGSLGHHTQHSNGEFCFTPKVVIASAPVVRPTAASRHGKRSKAASLEAMIKQSIDPTLQRYMFSKQSLGTDGQGSHWVIPDDEEAELVRVAAQSEGNSATAARSTTNTPEPRMDLMKNKVPSDEAAVALGLLGLSPKPSQDNDTSDTASRVSSQNFTFAKEIPQCAACRGRLVIHSCGKRALPIDYDEVAKVERERKAKEEEEKKRQRAEKRRMADQRRREARKQKQRELEEQRQREEEQERMRAMSYRGVASTPAPGLDEQRRAMIMASYASHVQAAQTATPAFEVNTVDYRPSASYVTTTAAIPEAILDQPLRSIVQPVLSPLETTEARLHSTSMATLSSADALVALASFAGAAKSEPTAPVTAATNGQTRVSPTTHSEPATSPHGFHSSPKQHPIPSFAAIRQMNGESTTTTGSAAQSFVQYGAVAPPAVETEAPRATTTYVWPPRPAVEPTATTTTTTTWPSQSKN
eukprot:Nitzschia sp. Nitz4//scaffold52_size167869//28169//31888//NITZ4_002263-RA/size167869-processed-gene-0.91-mRNA-1//1//CDS//3329553996//1474//frame0